VVIAVAVADVVAVRVKARARVVARAKVDNARISVRPTRQSRHRRPRREASKVSALAPRVADVEAASGAPGRRAAI
jgi:hypothetical protein